MQQVALLLVLLQLPLLLLPLLLVLLLVLREVLNDGAVQPVVCFSH